MTKVFLNVATAKKPMATFVESTSVATEHGKRREPLLSETQHPKILGLSEITYGRDSLDRTGQAVGIKEVGSPKLCTIHI